ncbi:DMT family transporter [Lentisphaera profundi]|uniref:DMT family transporter n=1 Tax=Lentisphaera profundi TaxID=1658616 RepID=A0ABY7VRR3_9BACT|nr:DMT family transporter [Lentisphaera profundi]WDE96397.1 DMT family transporter [Lentisphaera profundi]
MSPVLKVIITSVLWGTVGIFIREADNMSAVSLAFFRTLIPTVVLFIWLKSRKAPQKLFRSNWKWMILGSGLNSIRAILFFISFNLTTIGNAQVTLYSWPIWAAILGSFFLKEKVSSIQKFLLSIAFLGLLLMFSQSVFSLDDKHFLGICAMVLSAFILSFVFIVFKKYGTEYQSIEIVFFQNLLTPLLLLPLFIPEAPSLSLKQVLIASFLGLIIGVLAFSLFFSALKEMKTANAAQITYIEPLCGLLWAHLLYQESLSPVQIIGAILILGATFAIPVLRAKEAKKT